jgi:hypothetical protein
VGGIVVLDRPTFADPKISTVCFRQAWRTAVPGQPAVRGAVRIPVAGLRSVSGFRRAI